MELAITRDSSAPLETGDKDKPSSCVEKMARVDDEALQLASERMVQTKYSA